MYQKHMRMEAKTKSEMSKDLGISLRTFQRRINENGLTIPRGLICEKLQTQILLKLGFSENQSIKDKK